MTLRPKLTCLAAAILLGSIPLASHALQLGETAAQIAARHGGGTEDHASQTATFMWSGWTTRVQYADGIAQGLTYKKVQPLTSADILGILAGNGAFADWKEISQPDNAKRLWRRKDGAIAEFTTAAPYVVTLQTARSPRARELSGEKPTVVHTAPEPAKETGLPPSQEDSPQALVDEPLPMEDEKPTEAAAPEVIESASPPVPEPRQSPKAAVAETTKPAAPAVPLIPLFACGGSVLLLGFFLLARRKTPPAEQKAPATAPIPRASADEARADDFGAIHSLTSEQFEFLIGELHRREGYKVELPVAVGGDDDVDLILERGGDRTLVQCRHWKSRRVNLAPVREFHETLRSTIAKKGLLVSTGEFSREAVDFTSGRSVKLINGKTLARLLQKHGFNGGKLRQPKEWIDEFFAGVQWIEPRCPTCQASMTLRKPEDDARYWACSTAPRCDGHRAARRDLLECTPITNRRPVREAVVIDV